MISTKTFDVGARWIGSNVASALFNDVAGRASSAVDALLAPTKVGAMGAVWANNPIILPDVSILFGLGARRLIDTDLMRLACASQGVNLGWKVESPHQRNASTLWAAVFDASREVPTVAFIMSAWSRGYFENREEDAKRAIQRAGGNEDVWPRYLDSMYSYPAVGDLMEARNRDIITNDQWIEGLKRNGFGLSVHRRMFDKLRDRLPGPGDLIHFAVKEAFSVQIANEVGLYNEFPHEITPYMQGQGLSWHLGFDIKADGVERRANVMDLYWAAHWQPISPQQAIGMYHLLRPNRLQRYRDVGIDVEAFPLDEVKRWLRINDYPKSVRDQLVTLSFTPLRLVDIRSALTMYWRVSTDPTYANSIPADIRARVLRYNRAWGVEQFRDRGVLPEDANVQVDLVFATAAARAAGPAIAANRAAVGAAVKIMRKGYAHGLLTRENARGGLIDAGLIPAAADTFLDIEDAERQMRIAATAIASLRRGYLSGAIQGDEAFARLKNAGIIEERAQEIVNLWFSEFTANHKHATTERILKWVSTGRMSRSDAILRLQNLGWDNPDLVLLISEAEGRALTLRAQAIRAAQASERTRLGQLDKVRRQQEQALKAVQTAIRRQTPVTRLVSWLSKGRLTKAAFLQRMAAMAYPPDVAEQYARDAIESVPIATLQRWLRKREINESTFRANLAAKNLTPETIEKYLEDALRIEPQHLYPKPPQGYVSASTATLSAPQLPPPESIQQQTLSPAHPPLPEGADTSGQSQTALHTEPEVLHTVPAQSVPGGGTVAPGG